MATEAVEVQLNAALTVVEVPGNTPFALAAAARITHNQLNVPDTTLNANSTPPATKSFTNRVTMSGGAYTLDLRALTGSNGGAEDGNGLKVQAILFKALTTNSDPVTITEGASNGYELFGDGFSVALGPGASLWWFAGATEETVPDIGATTKTIDLAGTLADAVDMIIVMG